MPKKEEGSDGGSLAARCDTHMMPWIGCIQEHRNVYSLISNAFYQKDYVDPLEDSVPDGRRACFAKKREEVGDDDGYVVRFHGAELDLGGWREHLEADLEGDGGLLDDGGPPPAAALPDEGPLDKELHFQAAAPFCCLDTPH